MVSINVKSISLLYSFAKGLVAQAGFEPAHRLSNYNPNKLNTMKNSRCALRSVPFASAIFTDHRGKANKLCYVTLCNLLKLPRLTLLPPLWRAAIKKHIMRIVVYAVIVLLIPHRSGFYQLG